MSTNCDIIAFFLFMVNFQLSESQIPDASSLKLTFLLTRTFYLIKIENRTKNIKHSSHAIALNKGTIFAKKCCKKKIDIRKTKLVYLHTKFQVSLLILTRVLKRGRGRGTFTTTKTKTNP